MRDPHVIGAQVRMRGKVVATRRAEMEPCAHRRRICNGKSAGFRDYKNWSFVSCLG